MAERIAFIGTGLLGGAFVEAACAHGSAVTVWNRTAAKARALERFGAKVAPSATEAARGAERVHLVLPDDAVVEAMVGAVRGALEPGAVIVDHSTTLPAATAERSRRLNAEGVAYLHCPVFIGPAAARQAQGTILCSGPRPHFERVRPALERQAERVEYFGERPDYAAVIKLCGNAMIIGMSGLIADVYSVAANNGIAPGEARRVFDIVSAQGIVNGRGRKMAAGDFEATFELTMARKDVALMMEAAGALPLAALPGIRARMDAMIAEGYGAADAGVLGLRAYEAAAHRA